MKILIVDDEYYICEYIEDLLEFGGFKSTTVSTINKAKDLVKSEPFDIAIIDYHLKDGLGVEVIKAIRSFKQRTVVIGMSGSEMGSVFYKAGADYFMKKPFDPLWLLEILKKREQNFNDSQPLSSSSVD